MPLRAIPSFGAVTLGLIVAGAILLAVSLVASERGRTLLRALLIVPVVLLVIAFLAIFSWRAVSRDEVVRHQPLLDHLPQRGAPFAARHPGRRLQPTARLSGKITCEGRLLPRGTMRLVPTGANDRPMEILGCRVVKGRYALAEVPIGSYRAEVTAFRVSGGTESEEGEVESLEAEQYLPARYNEQSELPITVVRGENVIDLDLNVDLDEALADGKVPIALAAAQSDMIQSYGGEALVSTPMDRPPPAATVSEIAAADEDVAAALAAAPSAALPPAGETAAEGESPPSGELPDWVGTAPDKVEGVYRMPIEVGPYSTREECDQELPAKLRAAVAEYAATYLGRGARGQVRLPTDYIQREIVKDECEQKKEVKISPEGQPEKFADVLYLHVLLEFDRAVNARLEEEWHQALVAERLGGVGALGVLVFVFLGAVWSYLKIDLATGGAYRGRLRLVAGTLILIAIAVGWMLVRFASASVGV